MRLPTAHTPMMMSAGLAQAGSDSQPGPSIPTFASMLFITPYLGLKT